jgi:hypothetical protein
MKYDINKFRAPGLTDAQVFSAVFGGDGTRFRTHVFDEANDEWTEIGFDDIAEAMNAKIYRVSSGFLYCFDDGSAIVVAEDGSGWWIEGQEDA